ncbi:hypothetical protein [Cryobacterium mannosilyticum]|uniref:Tfp pilus assembly protein PilO n=1 Tax=Cryobacterium mannosilyticum TaxID=1259190 RepID=A0A4R8W8T6_9MICO|nr:hypothetical protein [Cryobacterium mannosilyticum]TFC04612.1 hypothetical protein E3O32_07810 [Cryobacterium mannosilyticum]
MDKNRLWVIGSVLLMGAILAFGFLLGIQPQLKVASTANAERLSVEASNRAQSVVLARLKDDFAGIDKVRAELAPLNLSVPDGTEMPAFVDQLSSLAVQSQVSITGMVVADAVAYAPVVAPAAIAPAAEAPAAGAAASPAPAPTDAAAAPAVPATGGIPPVADPRITAGNFASLALQITIKGDYDRVLDFVSGLQTGPRLFLLSGLTTTEADPLAAVASTEKGSAGAAPSARGILNATISGLVYVLVPPATPASASAPAPAK